ncbi:MAG: hypothetical protein AAF721_29345 [Myxococcota bacterium]
MSATPLHRASSWSAVLLRATVTRVVDDALVEVQCAGGDVLRCEVSQPVGRPAQPLRAGQRVVVAPPEAAQALGCVLGVLGHPRGVSEPPVETVRIEAGRELHLVCGRGSISIRADGKVVIRGLDVLSAASGLNRIKGAAVEVN